MPDRPDRRDATAAQVAAEPGRRRAFQYRASEADLAALAEAARLRGFTEGEKANCSAYLRELVRADLEAARGRMAPRAGHPVAGPARPGSGDTRGTPLAPAVVAQLTALYPQVQGACANLNQLLRDWHLLRRGLHSASPVTGERVAAVLGELEGRVVAPLAGMLGKPAPSRSTPSGSSRDAAEETAPQRRRGAAPPERPAATPSTADRFRARRR